MSDDKETITLRDRFAMAALPLLIERFKDNRWKSVNHEITSTFASEMKAIITMSYMIADEMRKARLESLK